MLFLNRPVPHIAYRIRPVNIGGMTIMNQYIPKYLKAKNRMLIFELIRNQRLISRGELVRQTGISFPTILKIVDKMLDLHVIVELDQLEQLPGAGRRGRLLSFNPKSFYAVGISLEGQIMSLGLVDLDGTCQYCRSVYLPVHEFIMDSHRLLQEVNDLMSLAEKENIPVLGIGIGFPAVVNPEKNAILRKISLDIFQETSFSSMFPEFTSCITLPYYLDNDVNFACQGESFLRRYDDTYGSLFYISLGTGCGGGLTIGGEPWYGPGYRAGEFGSLLLPVPSSTLSPPFENLENVVNLEAIHKKFHINLQYPAGLTDSLRGEIIDYLCPYFSYVIANVVHLLDIQHCILSGIIPLALGRLFFDRLQKSVDRLLPYNSIKVEPPISRDTGIIGAAVAVFNHQLETLFKESP